MSRYEDERSCFQFCYLNVWNENENCSFLFLLVLDVIRLKRILKNSYCFVEISLLFGCWNIEDFLRVLGLISLLL